MTLLLPLLVMWLAQAPAPAPATVPGEDEVRAAVQQYYDAQAARDPDRAAASWSPAANPRMSRDAFVAMFGDPAEDQYAVEIRSVVIAGPDARVRVEATRTRVVMREGRPFPLRSVFANAQVWHKDPNGWKLIREGPFADDLADQFVTLDAAARAAFLERQSRNDLMGLRYVVAQRATMAVTLRKDYVGGRTLFGMALDIARAAGDRRSEANALHNIAQAGYFLGEYAAASDAYGKELAVAREIDDQDASAAALFGLAAVAYARAEYTPALGLYREALAIYEKRDDGSSIGRALVSIGNIQYLQADYDAASASYRRGLTVLLAALDRGGAAFARRGLARVLAAQGDLAAALEISGQVLADARADLVADLRLKSPVGAALESLGDLYYRLGNTAQARTALEEAKRLDDDDPESAGRVLAALGLTELVANRFDAAFAAYSDSRVRYESAKIPEGVARAWVGVGFSQTARQKFADAITAYRTAIRLFEGQRNNDGAARAWLGLSLAQSGASDNLAALESAGKVTAIADLIKSDDLSWRGAVRTGEALRKLDRLDDARQAFERAIGAIDRLAADAPVSPDARGALSDSADAWAGLALTLAHQGDAAGALRAMEARRAHVRRVDFAAFQHDIAPGATADELADEQGLVREIVSTRVQIRAEALAEHRDPARAERLGQQLAALTAKRAEQQARLYARLPDLPLWRGLPQPVLEPAALNTLVPGVTGVLVAYLITDDELLIVTVARGEQGPEVAATTKAIDRRAFADALSAAMQPAVLQDAEAWATRAAPLTAALVDPIASRLAARDRIVVVPDDLLWKVPFEALPAAAGGASTAGATYATSLATLALQRRSPPMPDHRTPAFLAAPAIPEMIRSRLLMSLPSWQPQDTAIALAAARASAAAYGEDITVRSAADASETSVRALLTTADIVHVQAPLQVSGATPLLSSLILAATGDAIADDGRMEMRDWFDIAGRARVVVLPDGSAFGAAGAGNAMDPIAWAAAAAGVSTLMVGRWPADAFTGDALATAVHTRLASGAAIADAWRAAVAAARDKSAAPSSWAGLRLIGGGG